LAEQFPRPPTRRRLELISLLPRSLLVVDYQNKSERTQPLVQTQRAQLDCSEFFSMVSAVSSPQAYLGLA
jgi:hypothetical protein